MKIISHRGLADGPNKSLENNPGIVEAILKKGIDCEIDIWLIKDKWFLGHDDPMFEIEYEFLFQHGLWLHAKNLEALFKLTNDNTLNYFWHQTDDYTLTSKGYIWTYPGRMLTMNSVMVLPEQIDISLDIVQKSKCFGICTDYVNKVVELIKD